MNLESILTSEAGLGLTEASPAQRARCRAIAGLPLGDLASHPDVIAFFGGVEAVAALPVGTRPTEVVCADAVKTAKTLTAVALSISASQTVDVEGLKPGEIPRVSVVCPKLDLAQVFMSQLTGALREKPALRALLMEEPTKDSVLLRHPTGRPIEIKCVAASAAGTTLVSRWSAGVVFDEACKMSGSEDGVTINLDDMRDSVLGRLRPGAQIVYISSAGVAAGPFYKAVTEGFGHPTPDRIVTKGPGPLMNPKWWTPERCARLEKASPRAYQMDCLVVFVDPNLIAFESALWMPMFRRIDSDLPLDHRADVRALGRASIIMDSSGGRGDSWVWNGAQWVSVTIRDSYNRVVPTEHGERERAVLLVAHVGAVTGCFADRGPSVITDIVTTITALARSLGTSTVIGDQFSALSNAEHFRKQGITLHSRAWTGPNKAMAVARARHLMREREIVVQAGQHTEAFKAELTRYQENIKQSGASSFAAGGSAHDDFVSACILGVAYADCMGFLSGSPAKLQSTVTDYGSESFSFG